MPTKKTGKPRKVAKAKTARAPRSANAKRKPAAKPKPKKVALKKATRTVAAAKAKAAPPRARRAAAAPVASGRRAIFIDVENTSSEDALFEVIDALKIDRHARTVELAAVGNWRAIGPQMARRLASIGAQLVHSAPARGVRDWSDLWIAVAAGCFLGQAAPGDVLEIVSNDRAFDAVGDAAAARGVVYERLQLRRGAAPPVESDEPKPARRTRGGRRRTRGRGDNRPPLATPSRPQHTSAAAPPHTSRAPHVADEPHAASRDQMIGLISRLTKGEHGRWVNLDILENALKAEGFSRPPGSPRLVTRLRMLKEVEVDSHGRVRVVPGEHAPTPAEAHAPAPAPVHAPRQRRAAPATQPPANEAAPAAEGEAAAETPTPPKRRRRSRSRAGTRNVSGDEGKAPIETQAAPEE